MSDLLDKQLAFVMGKGGVGRTTISYALGLAAAAAGKRAIVCEIASQERGSKLFGCPPIGFHETQMSEGLWAISLDPDRTIREYLEVQMPLPGMASILSRSNLFGYLAAATPGLQEMVTMGKVWELALNERKSPDAERTYDIVIVDAPATGHGRALLQAPHAFRDLARAGPLADQASRIERTLANRSATGVAIVARAEEMAVNESIGLEAALTAPGGGTEYSVDETYVNAVYPDRFSPAELRDLARLEETLGKDTEAARPALAAAGAAGARASAQAAQIARLDEARCGDLKELPFLFDEAIGPPQLTRLAEMLG
ncbi:MAG: AAA family ATPase [Solirubrobacterales bacterium]|nr:AAA family ATPase [Solirubrobacterales bacterium]